MRRRYFTVRGKLVCDPLTMDRPSVNDPEARRKARENLAEELEKKNAIRYEMRDGVLCASIWVAT